MNRHPSTEMVAHHPPVIGVGELALAIKRHIEQGFDVVRVKGELTGLKRAGSGHLYFSLKDEDACLDSVCWRSSAVRLGIDPQDGMEVVATGRLTTYPDRSKYQLVVDQLEVAGEGALLKLLEERRKRLAAEGLFDAGRKRPLPFLPEVIGVVTSPSGAVIRDILHRLADRFPRRVLLWPVLVQGSEAAAQVAAAIDGFNRLPAAGGAVPRPDLLIVARGGGSLEDLWAFNEEIVVRAAAGSAIPLIAAVGHETDTTLIDFAADRRAPTPSAAAEMAVPVRVELAARLATLGARQAAATTRTLDERRARVQGAGRGLPRPQALLQVARQRLDDWSERLAQSLDVGLERRQQRVDAAVARLPSPLGRLAHARNRLAGEARALEAALRGTLARTEHRLRHAAALLDGVSWQRALDRGFALVCDRDGHPLTTTARLRAARKLTITLADGSTEATVDAERPTTTPARRSRPGPSGQGSLF